jgi:hypothetical protein
MKTHNIDFAVLFDYGDNDFTLPMQSAAELFCEQFNIALDQLEVCSSRSSIGSKYYIKEINKLRENVKEILKYGFLAERLQGYARTDRNPNIESALYEIKRDLDYIPWDGEKKLWEKDGEKYIEIGTTKRFIAGTNAEIADAIKNFGDVYEDSTKDFPVWCNCEVLILYMKDGRLTYITR